MPMEDGQQTLKLANPAFQSNQQTQRSSQISEPSVPVEFGNRVPQGESRGHNKQQSQDSAIPGIESTTIQISTKSPNDLTPLTPGHFLIGEALTAPVESNVAQVNLNWLSRWQRIEQLRQHFWMRWSKEYMTQSTYSREEGNGWEKDRRNKIPNVKIRQTIAQESVGDLVLLVEENLPPLNWKMGRIIEVHPGKDNRVRVVTVKTASGTTKRTVNKVCVLPKDE
ncbi:hypothetical protein GEV33_014133 [Tenebrio molitor]|uniref:DUF5641 domain-containing protein n=1 Tax=Tenebrio molitor TaxID=7067 RepID=A0A8J6L7E1_TENMO|nr:hypothetical protein GEV33_014133 [Tenebrio molitor]